MSDRIFIQNLLFATAKSRRFKARHRGTEENQTKRNNGFWGKSKSIIGFDLLCVSVALWQKYIFIYPRKTRNQPVTRIFISASGVSTFQQKCINWS